MTTYRIFADTPHKDFPNGSICNGADFPVELISEWDARWVIFILKHKYPQVEFKIIDSHGKTVAIM